MAHRFSDITFTESVLAMQQRFGSYEKSAVVRQRMPDFDRFTEREADFIQARDSFYMASVSEDSWPYIQHRGGEAGFLKVLDEETLAFGNLSGNGQYQSLGHFSKNDKIALFLMDYPHRRRLKILGRVKLLSVEEHLKLYADQMDSSAKVESFIHIKLEAFDWNCSKHITPRFTETEWARESI
ncbi:pyridoxamine 5'-phosphate oxidase family protein [Neptuniibacter sp. SY11_33]|uniref:pyridoxamine 5'-phosphate oxidase family protein n=1 Tax=Neptuniibacter sp. SY11_33 TaxID=3398215 RepID=UPI0039F5ED86